MIRELFVESIYYLLERIRFIECRLINMHVSICICIHIFATTYSKCSCHSRSRVVERILCSYRLKYRLSMHACCLHIEDAMVSLMESVLRQKILTEGALSYIRTKISSHWTSLYHVVRHTVIIRALKESIFAVLFYV